jgi:hypothetical protein
VEQVVPAAFEQLQGLRYIFAGQILLGSRVAKHSIRSVKLLKWNN